MPGEQVFKDQIRQNMEVYIDDTFVKSKGARTHINDLQETFATLQRYQMKLNPTKYAFRVTLDKFLDFMVSNREVKANSEKIKAIYDMSPPRMVKDI